MAGKEKPEDLKARIEELEAQLVKANADTEALLEGKELPELEALKAANAELKAQAEIGGQMVAETERLSAAAAEATARAELAEKKLGEVEADLKREIAMVDARMNLRIRNFPGIDWEKPVTRLEGYDRLPDGKEVPINGDKVVDIVGGEGKIVDTKVLRFEDGLCLTNEQQAAHRFMLRGMILHYGTQLRPA